jgi:2-haloacid dehalogenase
MHTIAGPITFVFDVVGTLVDDVGTVHRAVGAALGDRLGDVRASRFADEWLAGLSSATDDVAAGRRPWATYESLRSETLAGLLRQYEVPLDDPAANELDDVGARLEAFPDAARGLDKLGHEARVVGLTNTDLWAASDFSALDGFRWHALLSVEVVQAFKPAPAAYRLVIDALRLDPHQTVFVAAHPWDLRAAASHGFRTAHVPRPHADRAADDDAFDHEVRGVGDLVGIAHARARERVQAHGLH